jgi:hypothetical protein
VRVYRTYVQPLRVAEHSSVMSIALVSSYIWEMRRVARVHGGRTVTAKARQDSRNRRTDGSLHAGRTFRSTEAVVKSDAAEQVWPCARAQDRSN